MWAWRASGSTVEMTRSGTVRWAMRQRPRPSPGSTSWPATSASRATAAACSSFSGQVLGRPHQLVGVVDQFGHEALHAGGVLPVTRGATTFEVVLADPHLRQLGDQATNPADLGDEHGDGVWRDTASSRTVESSARRVLVAITPEAVITALMASKMRWGRSEARSLFRHRTSTVGVERLIGERQAGRRLPGDVGLRDARPGGPRVPRGPAGP